MVQAIAFYLFSATALVFAVFVVAGQNPIHSALSMIGCLFAVAGVFALNAAQRIAILQVLLYAGAIPVLFLLVLLLLGLAPEQLGRPLLNWRKTAAVLLLAAAAVMVVGWLASAPPRPLPETDVSFGTIEGVALMLFNRYVLPFSMVTLLLLTAIVGAVILVRRGVRDPS